MTSSEFEDVQTPEDDEDMAEEPLEGEEAEAEPEPATCLLLSTVVDAMDEWELEGYSWVLDLTDFRTATLGSEFQFYIGEDGVFRIPGATEADKEQELASCYASGFAPMDSLNEAIAGGLDLDGHRLVFVPQPTTHEQYEVMEDYIAERAAPEHADVLTRAIQGKGAFRRFKDTAAEFDELTGYFRYRDERYFAWAREWCEANDMEFEDNEEPLLAQRYAEYDEAQRAKEAGADEGSGAAAEGAFTPAPSACRPGDVCVLVVTTVGSLADAEAITADLMQRKLAACVHQLPVHSTYRWQGAICKEMELTLTIKTRASLYGQVEARIQAGSSYDVPEIYQIPMPIGTEPYLRWIREQTSI